MYYCNVSYVSLSTSHIYREEFDALETHLLLLFSCVFPNVQSSRLFTVSRRDLLLHIMDNRPDYLVENESD